MLKKYVFLMNFLQTMVDIMREGIFCEKNRLKKSQIWEIDQNFQSPIKDEQHEGKNPLPNFIYYIFGT
jgi:hypothetical protein